MELNKHQNELKNIQTTPLKINCKDFFDHDDNLSFYQKIISEFVFYFIKESTNKTINEEIESIILDKYIKFSTFCFNTYEFKRYIHDLY